MAWLLTRILKNGLAAAAVLAVMGLVFTEFARTWLAVGAPARDGADPNAAVTDLIRFRVPLLMAAWGFGFVAASEALLFVLRGGPPSAKTAPRQPKAETAEVLLDELLRQTDEMRRKAEAHKPEPDTGPAPSLSIHS